LPILVDFLLSKIIFERVPLFWLKGWGPPLNSDLRPTMVYTSTTCRNWSPNYPVIVVPIHSTVIISRVRVDNVE
jgi:hypothetical protein